MSKKSRLGAKVGAGLGFIAGGVAGAKAGNLTKNRHMFHASKISGRAAGAALGARLGDRVQHGEAKTKKELEGRQRRSRKAAMIGGGLSAASSGLAYAVNALPREPITAHKRNISWKSPNIDYGKSKNKPRVKMNPDGSINMD